MTFGLVHNTFQKLNSHVSLQRASTQLLKIVHRSCCEKFHVGTTELLINESYKSKLRQTASWLGLGKTPWLGCNLQEIDRI